MELCERKCYTMDGGIHMERAACCLPWSALALVPGGWHRAHLHGPRGGLGCRQSCTVPGAGIASPQFQLQRLRKIVSTAHMVSHRGPGRQGEVL